MSILCLVMYVLCIYAVKLLSGFFGTRSGFFGENRLATLVSSSTLKTISGKLLKTGYVKLKRRKAVVSAYYIYVCEDCVKRV